MPIVETLLTQLLIQMQGQEVELSPDLLKSMASARISKEHSKDVICLEFSMDGTRLYSCDETMINIYETHSAKKIKTIFLKSLEIVRLCPTHNNDAILVATKKDNIVLYWSIHENAVIKIFKGHTDQICNLQISPKDDTFLTSARDQSVRLWDLNSMHHCKAAMTQHPCPCWTCTNTALVRILLPATTLRASSS